MNGARFSLFRREKRNDEMEFVQPGLPRTQDNYIIFNGSCLGVGKMNWSNNFYILER
jgi:hypothetical protein